MVLTQIKKKIVVKGDDSQEKLGMVHVITGDGKGKTTSSLGLGLRAIGNNLTVHMVQFLKSGYTGEIYSAKKVGFDIDQFGVDAIKEKQQKIHEFSDKTGRFVFNPDIKEQEAAVQGWEHSKHIIKGGGFNMVIMDEINCVLDKGLIPLHEVMEVIKNHGKVELIMTGRNAPKEIMRLADYVNVIEGVKHPWQKGIIARKGIEY
jgi:cob(I)alamin adenosyltransferase